VTGILGKSVSTQVWYPLIAGKSPRKGRKTLAGPEWRVEGGEGFVLGEPD